MQNPKKILYIWFAQLAFIIIDLNLQDIYILHFCIRNWDQFWYFLGGKFVFCESHFIKQP